MSRMSGCEYESRVLRAVADGAWTPELRDHVSMCDECSAAVAVGAWMARAAATDDRERALPDPAVVWMKAQLLRGSVTVDRAARPLQFIQIAAYFVVAAGWAALLTWKWRAIQAWIGGFTPVHFMANAATGNTLSATVFVIIFLLASATIFLALHTILAEE